MEGAAHAKVNLRHRVFARDESGYHGVETLLARTSLADTVALEEAEPGIRMEVGGPSADGVPDGSDNLCWRAAERFLAEAFPRGRNRPGVRLRLTKRVPAGSGLGGGSADAAAALRLLAARWPRLDERRLISLAGELGSDVAFALSGVPLALGWERGRRLLPLRPPRPRPALLLCPGFPVSTPAAYGWLDASRAGGAGPGGDAAVLPGASRLAVWDALERLMRNDLEGPVLDRHPELARPLARLRERAPRSAGLTGSGSALFAIFEDVAARDRAREELGDGEARVFEVALPV